MDELPWHDLEHMRCYLRSIEAAIDYAHKDREYDHVQRLTFQRQVILNRLPELKPKIPFLLCDTIAPEESSGDSPDKRAFMGHHSAPKVDVRDDPAVIGYKTYPRHEHGIKEQRPKPADDANVFADSFNALPSISCLRGTRLAERTKNNAIHSKHHMWRYPRRTTSQATKMSTEK